MRKVVCPTNKNKFTQFLVAPALLLAALIMPLSAYAAPLSDVTQRIDPGTLSTNILDENRDPVIAPTTAMTTREFSFDCQTSTGTLGTNSQRIYISNPSAAATSWALSMAATDGTGAMWTNGTYTYSYNDPSGTPAGCDNGQLTVDPSVGTVTTDCTNSTCATATITKGASTAMTGATPVALMSGGTDASSWRGYLTGVGLSQVIPAGQPAGDYSINMTVTVVGS